MTLTRHLVISVLATAAAGVVLLVRPEFIAGAVGTWFPPEANLMVGLFLIYGFRLGAGFRAA